jgi:transcriptional regulator of met regulon
MNVENNLKEKHDEISNNYKEVIRGLEIENMSMRRRLTR